MEKLVELLNEYNKYITNGEIGWKKWNYDEDFGNLLYGDYNGGTFSEMYCISKRYGFIERLVKNDKIKWRAKTELYYNISCYNWDGGEYELIGPYFTDTEQIIMILSIQDNPIEYLCSILK